MTSNTSTVAKVRCELKVNLSESKLNKVLNDMLSGIPLLKAGRNQSD